ncbi:MAG: putative electron transfer flavoprotein FixA, partial [Saezia sp.]
VRVNADRTLSTDRAEPKISPYDLNALEAAVQLAAETGGKVTALSIGGSMLENSKLRKDVLSRGADVLNLVIDPSLGSMLPYETAQVLKAALGKMEYDLVLCGEGSADLYAQQVGLLLGEMLQLPALNGISKISCVNGKLEVQRALENEVEMLEVPLPAALCVTSDINVPKIPNMKSILAAGKKPVQVMALQDLGLVASSSLVVMEEMLAPERTERKKMIIDGDSAEAVAEFAGYLSKVL